MARSERYKWWVVLLLWLVCLFNYADRQAIFSVFPLLQAEMGLTDVQLGVVGGAFMWVYALALPLAGMIGDQVARKTLIVGGLVFWSLVTLATAGATRYAHLVWLRALEGLGEAFYFPASMSLISDYHGPRTRSRAMALHQSSVYLGTIAGGTAAGYLGQSYGWRSGFVLFGTLGVVLSAVVIAALKEPKRERTKLEGPPAWSPDAIASPGVSPREAVLTILRTPMVLVLIVVFIGANFVAAIFLTWLPTFLGRKFGMSLALAGLNGTAWLQVASILGVLAGGALADRLARQFRAGRMIAQAIGLLAGVPFLVLIGASPSVRPLVLALTAFGFCKGIYDANIWASLYDVVAPEHRGTALGLMNAIGWVGGGVAPVAVAGGASRYGMSACLGATSLIYLSFGLLLVLGIRVFLPGRTASNRLTPPSPLQAG